MEGVQGVTYGSSGDFAVKIHMARRTGILVGSILVGLFLVGWFVRMLTLSGKPVSAPVGNLPATSATLASSSPPSASGPTFTSVYAHNVELRKGPNFRVYVPWLHGKIIRTRREVNPSFDDPDSFILDVDNGIIRANVGDLINYLNVSAASQSPLKNISLVGDGDQVKLHGTVHKILSLPIEIDGTISPYPDRQIRMHVTKLSILKVPLKGVLGAFKLTVADLFDPHGTQGIRVSGNDVFFDTQQLLPPPHITGQFTSVRMRNPDLEVTYGNAQSTMARVEQWRNFLQLLDGSIDFGKLTMHHVDIIMIDTSNDAWFDLDLNHYQEQLVNGYTRMTPQAGLQIFMPDLETLPHNKAVQNISIEWMKNRNLPPPSDIMNR